MAEKPKVFVKSVPAMCNAVIPFSDDIIISCSRDADHLGVHTSAPYDSGSFYPNMFSRDGVQLPCCFYFEISWNEPENV